MISVIIPAHNEARTIARTLRALAAGPGSSCLDVVVVANGCSDSTAAAARDAWPAIRVIETPIASKPHALNLGDEVARFFPRAYLDADIELSESALQLLAERMAVTGSLAASPGMKMRYRNASWCVRAYYEVWQRLPYVREGMIGVGVYMLSEAGRRRFPFFPEIIADDGFIRRLFSPHERVLVEDCLSIVTAPTSVWGLLKIKTRSRLGGYQLNDAYPDLLVNETKDYGGAVHDVLRNFSLWFPFVVYLAINTTARIRALFMYRRGKFKVWERDETSRQQ